MDYSSRYLEDLIERLSHLPTIGRKTAQRLAFHLMRVPQEEALGLARTIQRIREEVGRCEECGNLAETQPCYLCQDERRDRTVLCIVEQPGDVVAVEKSGAFHGQYHVLAGAISPLDGVGPDELGIDALLVRIDRERFREVILATNPTVEGEATAHFIGDLAKRRGVRATRIAHGVPVGGELEYVDGGTLAHALAGRQTIG